MTLQLLFTEEQTMLHEMLTRFVAERCELEARAANLNAAPPRRLALWPELCELGVPAALLPADAGGFGGTPADIAVVQDALAGGLLVEPLLTSVGLCASILHAAGRPVATVLSGETIYAFAHQEGFDALAAPRLSAKPSGPVCQLTGLKPAVRHADVADRLIVSAAGPEGPLLFDIAVDHPGVTLSGSRLIDGAGSADVRFDAVSVSAEDRLDGDAAALIDETVLRGLAMISVEAAALARATNRATFEFMGVREQFGTRLADFQALQHKAADMAIAAEEMAAQAGAAVDALDAERSDARVRRILIASLACDAGGRTVGHTAVQLFGGMGVSDETPVSHHVRRYAAMRAQFGTTDARAARLGLFEDFIDG